MNDSGQKACVFGGLIVAIYAIYALTNVDEPDGYIFATVIAAVVGIGGYVVGAMRTKEKA